MSKIRKQNKKDGYSELPLDGKGVAQDVLTAATLETARAALFVCFGWLGQRCHPYTPVEPGLLWSLFHTGTLQQGHNSLGCSFTLQVSEGQGPELGAPQQHLLLPPSAALQERNCPVTSEGITPKHPQSQGHQKPNLNTNPRNNGETGKSVLFYADETIR